MEKIATDCGRGGCEYAENVGSMRPASLCICDRCPSCNRDLRRRGHAEHCARKGWQRGMPRHVEAVA